MTETVKSWIQERRSIHADGTDVLLRSSYELERESGIEEGTDIDAIVDAHNNLPRALDALEQVLELHERRTAFDGELDYCGICVESEGASWPCPTVRAIEGAIND